MSDLGYDSRPDTYEHIEKVRGYLFELVVVHRDDLRREA